MQAGVGLLILDVMPIYRSLPGYHHDYLKFYQLPNSKSFPMFAILRDATSESYGPRGLVSINLLLILFSFAFVPNVSDLNHILLCIKNPSTFDLSSYRQGLDNPLVTLGVEICFLVCRG
jgi:hypothetical protein